MKFLLFVFMFMIVIVSGCRTDRLSFPSQISQICLSSYCFKVEIAQSQSEREHGLMERNSLDSNAGMLFVFEKEGVYPFWMKNTLIPLDMIWISRELQIVDIQTASPCIRDVCEIYTPHGKALYVLEINAGLSQKYHLMTGMNIVMR